MNCFLNRGQQVSLDVRPVNLRRISIRTVLFALIIHGVFAIQSYLSLPKGGMVTEPICLILFYPQYLLVFFLPPAYPISHVDGRVIVDYLAFFGKMLSAFPASLFYGLFLSLLLSLFRKPRQA